MIRNDNKGVNMDYKELLSVGCLITKDLKVFPINCNEVPETASQADEYDGVHIYDLDGEWYNNLSSDDLTDFFSFIELHTDVVTVVYNAWKDGIWGDWETANNCYINMEVI
jgi:hypothetical protein